MRKSEIVLRIPIPHGRLGRWIGVVACLLALGEAVVLAGPFGQSDFGNGELLSHTRLNDYFRAIEMEVSVLKQRTDVLEKFKATATYQSRYSIGALYCGKTAPFDGAMGGLAKVKGECEKIQNCGVSAHMCTSEELIRSAALGRPIENGWFAAGDGMNMHGDFRKDDCGSFTVNVASRYGVVWNNGKPDHSGCGVAYPVLCCS